jgi:hypothetical protein
VPKDFPLWGSLTKDYKIFKMVFTNDLHIIYIFKTSYSHIIFLQVLISTSNTKPLNANYEPKVLIITPYILEEVDEWLIIFIYI